MKNDEDRKQSRLVAVVCFIAGVAVAAVAGLTLWMVGVFSVDTFR